MQFCTTWWWYAIATHTPKTASKHPVALAWAFLCMRNGEKQIPDHKPEKCNYAPQPTTRSPKCRKRLTKSHLKAVGMTHHKGRKPEAKERPEMLISNGNTRVNKQVWLRGSTENAKKCPSKGHWVVRCGFGGVGGDRVSSSATPYNSNTVGSFLQILLVDGWLKSLRKLKLKTKNCVLVDYPPFNLPAFFNIHRVISFEIFRGK